MNIIYQEKLFVSIFCSKCVVIDYGIIFNCFYKTQWLIDQQSKLYNINAVKSSVVWIKVKF